MSILTSGGARFIDRDGLGAVSVSNLVLRKTSTVGSVDYYEFLTTGTADDEFVDVTSTSTYETVAAGTSPSATRAVFRSVAGNNIIMY